MSEIPLETPPFSAPSTAGMGARAVPVREMIGRTASPLYVTTSPFTVATTTDKTQANHAWWDKYWRGKQPGHELGSLFAKPIANILTDWMLGKGVSAQTGDDITDAALADFIDTALVTLMTWVEQSHGLGDAYLAVETDGSLTPLSPDLVKPILNPENARDVWGYTITSKPSESVEIVDEYRIKPVPQRHLVVKGFVDAGDGTRAIQVNRDEIFPLLIDELPIIPLHNGASPNEVFGHPEYEALRYLSAEYNDIFDKALKGVKVMGTPKPSLEEVEDPLAEIEALSQGRTANVTLVDGTIVAVPQIDFSNLSMIITRGKLRYPAPSPFTQDTGRLLEFLFLLMLQHSRIPEWVWGGAVASSKASVDAQWPAWERFIQGRQMRLAAPIRTVARVHLKYRALVERGLRPDLKIRVDFPNLASRSEENLRGWTELADKAGAIRKETIVRVADLPGVQDPTAEVAAAAQEGMDRQAVAEAAMQAEIERLAIERNQENAA